MREQGLSVRQGHNVRCYIWPTRIQARFGVSIRAQVRLCHFRISQ